MSLRKFICIFLLLLFAVFSTYCPDMRVVRKNTVLCLSSFPKFCRFMFRMRGASGGEVYLSNNFTGCCIKMQQPAKCWFHRCFCCLAIPPQFRRMISGAVSGQGIIQYFRAPRRQSRKTVPRPRGGAPQEAPGATERQADICRPRWSRPPRPCRRQTRR